MRDTGQIFETPTSGIPGRHKSSSASFLDRAPLPDTEVRSGSALDRDDSHPLEPFATVFLDATALAHEAGLLDLMQSFLDGSNIARVRELGSESHRARIFTLERQFEQARLREAIRGPGSLLDAGHPLTRHIQPVKEPVDVT